MHWLVAFVSTASLGLLVLLLSAHLAFRHTPYSAARRFFRPYAPDPALESDDIGSARLLGGAILTALGCVLVVSSLLLVLAHASQWSHGASAASKSQPDLRFTIVCVLLALLLNAAVLRDALQLQRFAWWSLAGGIVVAVLLWAVLQGWLLTDLLAVLLAIRFILGLQPRLSFLRLSCVLAVLAGLYDAVQVYVTGNMARAAQTLTHIQGTDGHRLELPLLITIPSDWSWHATPLASLGTGDVVISGLLVVNAARLARRLERPWLYRASLVGFAAGLGLTWAVVTLSHSIQPATIFLVPTIVGAVCVAAQRSGNWPALKTKPYAYVPYPASKQHERQQPTGHS